jgi:hypothetical protein
VICGGGLETGISPGIRIDVSRTKAIRSEILRTELFIPGRLWPPSIFQELMDLCRHWISTERGSTLAPSGTTAKELNDYLRRVWDTLKGEGRYPTTYTFRRAAFHRFIAGCQNREGAVQWGKVAALTLHLNEKTAKAFYHLGVGKEKRSE